MGILEKKTFEKFGYNPKDLKPKSNKKIIVACNDCGKVRISSRKLYRNYCPSCAKKGDKHSQWKGGKVKQICQNCGTKFSIDRCEIKKGWGKTWEKRIKNKMRNTLNGWYI